MAQTQTPSMCRIVDYRVTKENAEAINRRRKDAHDNPWMRENKTGAVMHVGSEVMEGDPFPLVIVRVTGKKHSEEVSGQVLLDGNDTLWVVGVEHGNDPGQFAWPKMTG